MDVNRCKQAAETLRVLAKRAATMQETERELVIMTLHLQIAAVYLVNYAGHLEAGMDPYEAIRAAPVGATPLSDSHVSLIKLMNPLNAIDTDPGQAA